ncbi:MAG: hypothetical protein HOI95_29595 [Chromatiales bacterium]|jgi:catechol 2,3-dioxygenase-like lactoylglutathione lyase family enzyme|nr:hypothetical protein [Chromatiales bacterium]
MPITKLEHYLILADDIDATKDFYVDVLDLEVGARPPFPFPGYWLYLGELPVVHLAAASATKGQQQYMGRASDGQGSSALDHVAFSAEDIPATVARLEEAGIEMIRRDVPEARAHQIFIQDPSGVTVELNFAAG